MGTDKLAGNTPNGPKFICPKVWDFDEKRQQTQKQKRLFIIISKGFVIPVQE
jgi:hypothetical protein